MPISVVRQVTAPLAQPRRIQQLFQITTRYVTAPKPFTVSAAVIGDATMRKLNNRYRQSNMVTDVLSFSYSKHDGELVICYPQVVRQARSKLLSVNQELSWVTVHGLLHLLGYDHETPTDAKIMRPLEQLILQHV